MMDHLKSELGKKKKKKMQGLNSKFHKQKTFEK